jgi:hypothetical protein
MYNLYIFVQYCPRKKHWLQPPIPFTGTKCSIDSRDDGLPHPNSKAIENEDEQQIQQGVVTLERA